MKRQMTVLAMMAMMIFLGASSALAWMFEIDPGSGATSHNINFVAGGDTVTLDGYTLVFDYTGANLTSGIETPPSPLSALLGPYNDTGGTVNFTATTFGTGATLSTDQTLATFTFDGDATLTWNLGSQAFLVTVNGTEFSGADFQLTSANTISPVPLPGAVWLLGSGLIGLFGLRRRSGNSSK